MNELSRVIFGNLPLLGISYKGEQKDDEYRRRFSHKDEMKKVMRISLHYGIRYFAASAHEFNERAPVYLDAIKEVETEDDVEIILIACIGIPLEFQGKRIDDYRRWSTHLTYESTMFGADVRERYFEDPILKCRAGWRENLTKARPYELKELESELKINWNKWEDSLLKFSDYHIAWIELGSETDFLAVCRIDLLEEILDRTKEFGHKVLLGSHHLGASARLIQEESVEKFDGYVTPANRLGHMMFPTANEAENAIEKAQKEGKLIISVKPFAGGRIKPEEALTYVYRKLKADACMIGVASVEEAEEDFRTARKILEL